jgi:hypothetical protein
MSPILSLESHPDWRYTFGRRYLQLDRFVRLCEAVGLYQCTDIELEEYERERWLFPAARMVMPEEYARAYWHVYPGHLNPSELNDKSRPFYQLDEAIRFQIPIPGEFSITLQTNTTLVRQTLPCQIMRLRRCLTMWNEQTLPCLNTFLSN